MKYAPPRFVLVPWWRIEQSDLVPQGKAEATMSLPQTKQYFAAYHIRGLESAKMLGIRTDAAGRLTCVIIE